MDMENNDDHHQKKAQSDIKKLLLNQFFFSLKILLKNFNEIVTKKSKAFYA